MSDFPRNDRGRDFQDDWENFKGYPLIDIAIEGSLGTDSFLTDLSVTPEELKVMLVALANYVPPTPKNVLTPGRVARHHAGERFLIVGAYPDLTTQITATGLVSLNSGLVYTFERLPELLTYALDPKFYTIEDL